MKTKLLRLITSNKSTDRQTMLSIFFIWIIGTLVIWSFNDAKFLPTPLEIITASKNLFLHQDFLSHLFISTWLCIKAIFYSTLISLFIALLSTIPIMKPFSGFAGTTRFLSTIGLTFIFAILTPDTNTLKVVLLVFCISVFLITSFLGIVRETKKEELDYAKTLKMNDWMALYKVMILGKADQYLEAIKQNFAISWMMLAMVENLCRAEGGIGVILFQENKQFHLDAVYAIQIMVLIVGIGLDWCLGFIRRIFCPYSVLMLDKK